MVKRKDDKYRRIVEFCERVGIPYTTDAKKIHDIIANQNANDNKKTYK